MSITHLIDRAIIRLSGEETKTFLQNLVSNDANTVSAGNAVLAALLSPQGKFLFDFFMVADGDDILLETEAEHADALIKRLNLYKLRSKITITKEENLNSYVAFEDNAPEGSNAYPDPRDKRLGARFITMPTESNGSLEDYEMLRISLGIPEGSKDATERTILLENGYDKLGGVSFTKGCYIGQEVTARSYHKGELRKYIFKVEGESNLPANGTPIMAGESTIGEMRSTAGKLGLALIRTDRFAKATEPITADGIPLTITAAFWHNTKQPS